MLLSDDAIVASTNHDHLFGMSKRQTRKHMEPAELRDSQPCGQSHLQPVYSGNKSPAEQTQYRILLTRPYSLTVRFSPSKNLRYQRIVAPRQESVQH